jgi:hypothetical protein
VTPVARALAERRVPFALVTGCDSYDIEEPILRTAMRVPKPYRPTELRQALLRLVRPAGGHTRAAPPVWAICRTRSSLGSVAPGGRQG